MDVVNGKIVPARTERSRLDIWSALKPSCASVEHGNGLMPPPGYNRAASVPSPGAPSSMALEPGTARWHRWSRDTNNILGQPHKQLIPTAAAAAAAPAGSQDDDLGVQKPFRAGWKRSFTEREHYNNRSLCSTGTSTTPVSGRSTVGDQEFSLSSCDELLEMLVNAPTNLRVEVPELCGAGEEALERPGLEDSGVDQVGGIYDDVTWIAPLRSLLRKELTVSDVGELGRIILPKKDAEGQFPLVETKGKQLEMEEYSFSKRWFFQYKCWINNKSRMYVLENTRGFIKYHGLKADDSFIVYEDGCGNLVVRGQKKSNSTVDHWNAKPYSPPSWMARKKD